MKIGMADLSRPTVANAFLELVFSANHYQGFVPENQPTRLINLSKSFFVTKLSVAKRVQRFSLLGNGIFVMASKTELFSDD